MGKGVPMSTAALILAAGEGTRMKSDLPKVAHRVLGVPMVRLVADIAHAAGVERAVVVTGHGAETVRALVPDETCVLQEQQLGTGHAVMCAMEALGDVEGLLLVLSGDAPLLRPETVRRLVQACESSRAAVAVLTTRMSEPFGYGRIIRDQNGALAAIVEQRDLAPGQFHIDEVNTGTYCFDAAALGAHIHRLTAENSQQEYYLTDLIGHLREEGLHVVDVSTDEPAETMGVNTRVQLAEATKVLQHRLNEAHMLAGVTMIDPDLVWVSPGVRLGRDVVLEPMTVLEGATSVAESAHIGPNSRLTDVVVGERARIDSSVVIHAEVGRDATVGPMAYVRPGALLKDGSKVGTFVEIKNSTVGEGSKVPHLSYMGDATIGTGVNVGAGSITCNYDGMHKHPTAIEDGAFIGSDTMFVAPVRIGAGAVTGAGSVVTRDVPAGALGVERSEQRNVEGWADRRRAGQTDE
jgi:bifunctional UDP-N-acetylglucosamine pyrophosphorylase/glucosamine-1-phosphate N-acetyltransferase